MDTERRFVMQGIRNMEIEEFLRKELERAGFGGLEIHRTPLGTRVKVYAERPGLVIGRRGKKIRDITRELERRFGLDNPQVEVKEIEVPELNAEVMAYRIARMLERGVHFRRAAYSALRRIMGAGARGAEIKIAGKLTGERARYVKFSDGYLKKAGEPAQVLVRSGFAVARLNPGVIGVTVKIMPPDIRLPDEVEVLDIDESKIVEKVGFLSEDSLTTANSDVDKEVKEIGDTESQGNQSHES